VQNYVRAATKGIELIETLPICLRLVARLQKILVARTRGDSYDSGRLHPAAHWPSTLTAALPPPGQPAVGSQKR
jgi:hypothetical protein